MRSRLITTPFGSQILIRSSLFKFAVQLMLKFTSHLVTALNSDFFEHFKNFSLKLKKIIILKFHLALHSNPRLGPTPAFPHYHSDLATFPSPLKHDPVTPTPAIWSTSTEPPESSPPTAHSRSDIAPQPVTISRCCRPKECPTAPWKPAASAA